MGKRRFPCCTGKNGKKHYKYIIGVRERTFILWCQNCCTQTEVPAR